MVGRLFALAFGASKRCRLSAAGTLTWRSRLDEGRSLPVVSLSGSGAGPGRETKLSCVSSWDSVCTTGDNTERIESGQRGRQAKA